MYYLPTTEKVYLDQPYVKIMWKAEGNSLHVEWRMQPTSEHLLEVLSVQRHIIRKYGCTKVICNNSALKKTTLSHATV